MNGSSWRLFLCTIILANSWDIQLSTLVFANWKEAGAMLSVYQEYVKSFFESHLINIDWVSPQIYQSVNLYTIGWLTQFNSPLSLTCFLQIRSLWVGLLQFPNTKWRPFYILDGGFHLEDVVSLWQKSLERTLSWQRWLRSVAFGQSWMLFFLGFSDVVSYFPYSVRICSVFSMSLLLRLPFQHTVR